MNGVSKKEYIQPRLLVKSISFADILTASPESVMGNAGQNPSNTSFEDDDYYDTGSNG